MLPLNNAHLLLFLAISVFASASDSGNRNGLSHDHDHSQLHNYEHDLPFPKGFKPAQVTPSSGLTNPDAVKTVPIPGKQDDDEAHRIPSEGSDALPQGYTMHAPYPGAFSHFSKRSVAGMYECAGRNWAGPCKWTRADVNGCHVRQYNYNSSMGPDAGLICKLYNTWMCAGTALDGFRFPGIADFQNNGWLNQNHMHWGPLSYRCIWDPNYPIQLE